MRPTTEIRQSIQRMVCTGCGAEANASCNCGKPYVPKAVRAREAIEANPEKSNRAIAADTGIGLETVREARNELTGSGQLDDGPRTGLDGKTRRRPVRKAKNDELTPAYARCRRPDGRRDRRLERFGGAFVVLSSTALMLNEHELPPDLTPEIAAEAIKNLDEAIAAYRALKAKLEAHLTSGARETDASAAAMKARHEALDTPAVSP
jgi:hypothetical protein